MSAKYKILLYEEMHSVGTRLLAEKGEVVYARSFDESHLISLAADVDAIVIRANGFVSRAVIEGAAKLKVIGRHGAGLDGIDLAAAKERHIPVVYTPDANTESVAEHFVGLALDLAKKIKQGDVAVRQGNWKARYDLIGMELRGKTLGVLGFGRIGRQIARICNLGFAMPVIYHDEINYPEAEQELSALRLPMPEVFRQADLISINLPLLPGTRGCVNASLIKLMKPTAFLLNLARGPIWNEADLLAALESGQIAGAATDVFEEEPTAATNPLFRRENFLATPHMAAHTREAMIRMSLVAKDVLAVLEGKSPQYPVPGTWKP